MKWTDINEIAIALAENIHGVDPASTCASPICTAGCWSSRASSDHPKHSGEKILEAIQLAWIDEKSLSGISKHRECHSEAAGRRICSRFGSTADSSLHSE